MRQIPGIPPPPELVIYTKLQIFIFQDATYLLLFNLS